jgi:DUF971 family protein
MTTETVPTPVDVLAERSKKQVRIAWSDGHESTYDYAYLRGHCPCAGCQGHGGPHVFHEVEGAGAELASMGLVGSYAIVMAYGDGHDSGIYSYRFLREICPCEDHGGPGYAPGKI